LGKSEFARSSSLIHPASVLNPCHPCNPWLKNRASHHPNDTSSASTLADRRHNTALFVFYGFWRGASALHARVGTVNPRAVTGVDAAGPWLPDE